MRFLHIADVHLGNQQYNMSDRFNDFGRAFLHAVDLAAAREVDVCVIAGDLFHKASVDPLTLIQAEEGLQQLADAGIKTIAVHGNHDKARYLAQTSWPEYLHDRGLLRLLTPDFTTKPLSLPPDEAYLDVGNVRFLGVPWLGASAPNVLAQVAEVWDSLSWDGITYTVLITHAGVEGQMPNMPGGLTFAQLAPLKGKVDYLALGHLHKPYNVEDWIYNPGSLETCSFDEAQYSDRGVFLVDVNADGTPQIDLIATPKRPFYGLNLETDRYDTPEEVLAAVESLVRKEKRHIEALTAEHEGEQGKPVLRLVLRGLLSFDRTRLDTEVIRELLKKQIDALLIRVENRTHPPGLDAAPDAEMSREEMEREVFANLVRTDRSYARHADGWRDLIFDIKEMALERTPPEAIFARLSEHMDTLEDGADVDH